MTQDHSPRSTRTAAALSIVTGGFRIVADLLIIGLWVLLLTLLFLSTGWPRWLFYGLLLGGIGLYVRFTAGWSRSANAES
jgi:hypothetical protein